jgi:hypothetical protein
MKTTIKILTLLVMLNLPAIMNSQAANPFPVQNNTGCTVNFEWSEYDAGCALVSGPTNVTVLAGNPVNLMLTTGATDVVITVLWIGSAACPVTHSMGDVTTQCGGQCTGTMFSPLTTGTSCCPISNIGMSCGAAVIN